MTQLTVYPNETVEIFISSGQSAETAERANYLMLLEELSLYA